MCPSAAADVRHSLPKHLRAHLAAPTVSVDRSERHTVGDLAREGDASRARDVANAGELRAGGGRARRSALDSHASASDRRRSANRKRGADMRAETQRRRCAARGHGGPLHALSPTAACTLPPTAACTPLLRARRRLPLQERRGGTRIGATHHRSAAVLELRVAEPHEGLVGHGVRDGQRVPDLAARLLTGALPGSRAREWSEPPSTGTAVAALGTWAVATLAEGKMAANVRACSIWRWDEGCAALRSDFCAVRGCCSQGVDERHVGRRPLDDRRAHRRDAVERKGSRREGKPARQVKTEGRQQRRSERVSKRRSEASASGGAQGDRRLLWLSATHKQARRRSARRTPLAGLEGSWVVAHGAVGQEIWLAQELTGFQAVSNKKRK